MAKKKILKSAMFNRMNKFLEDINTKNIFDDLRLQELAQQARSVLDNTDSVSIKYNESLRNQLA